MKNKISILMILSLLTISVALADIGTPSYEGIDLQSISWGSCNPGNERGRGAIYTAKNDLYVTGLNYVGQSVASHATIVNASTNTTLASTTNQDPTYTFTFDEPVFIGAGEQFYAFVYLTGCAIGEGPIDYEDDNIIVHNSMHHWVDIDGRYENYRGDTGNPATTWWYGVVGAVVAPYVAPPCTPSWQCSEYSECLITPTNHKNCLAVTDANNCGQTFGGSLSDYTVDSCTVPKHGVNAVTAINNQKQTTATPNPIGQFILNIRSFIFRLIGIKE